MKAAMEQYNGNRQLQTVYDDFRTMKSIVEDSKRSGWNTKLKDGYRLIQDVEARFGTSYLVAERFLKASSKVFHVISPFRRDTSIMAFQTPTTNMDQYFWLVGCFLHQCTRDMKFWPCQHKRMEFRNRAETLTRTMSKMYAIPNGGSNAPVSNISQGSSSTTITAAASSIRSHKYFMMEYMDNADNGNYVDDEGKGTNN